MIVLLSGFILSVQCELTHHAIGTDEFVVIDKSTCLLLR